MLLSELQLLPSYASDYGEYGEILKNTYFEEHLRMTASICICVPVTEKNHWKKTFNPLLFPQSDGILNCSKQKQLFASALQNRCS